MQQGSRNNLWLGVLCVGLALVFALWAIPVDTDSGLVEKVRRKFVIGDALAPTVAAGFILLGGAMLMLFERDASEQLGLSAPALRFLVALLGIMTVAMVTMRFAGPLAVDLAGVGEYRLLRDTAPWKHIGFVLGGGGMVAALVSLLEWRITARALLVGIGAALMLIAIFDLPFDDLLLPPNGDV